MLLLGKVSKFHLTFTDAGLLQKKVFLRFIADG